MKKERKFTAKRTTFYNKKIYQKKNKHGKIGNSMITNKIQSRNFLEKKSFSEDYSMFES